MTVMADHVLALLRKKKKREELARVQERLQGPDVNPGLRELRSQEQTLTRQKQLGATRSRRTSCCLRLAALLYQTRDQTFP
jgi:hypothetical protein